jgi:hypothetical protein
MVNMEELSPELQEAVKEYRKYGMEVFGLDRRVQKYDRDEDYEHLRQAIEQRNFWQNRLKELLKGREKELNELLIG